MQGEHWLRWCGCSAAGADRHQAERQAVGGMRLCTADRRAWREGPCGSGPSCTRVVCVDQGRRCGHGRSVPLWVSSRTCWTRIPCCGWTTNCQAGLGLRSLCGVVVVRDQNCCRGGCRTGRCPLPTGACDTGWCRCLLLARRLIFNAKTLPTSTFLAACRHVSGTKV